MLFLGVATEKNPAYGRQRISRPMQIVGPIQFWRGCVIYLIFFFWRGRVIFFSKKVNIINIFFLYFFLGGEEITSRNDVYFFMYICIFRVRMPPWRTAGTDEFLSFFTIWVFGLNHNWSFCVSSQFEFLSFFTIWVVELNHNLSFWVSSQFEFLSFITIWFFDFFSKKLSFWVSSQFEFLSFILIWVFVFLHNLSFWVY